MSRFLPVLVRWCLNDVDALARSSRPGKTLVARHLGPGGHARGRCSSAPGVAAFPACLDGRGFARERVAQCPARRDAELGEHLLEVPLDGARAEEELGADLRVRPPLAREEGDVLLLGRELVAGVLAALAHLLAGGEQ